MIDDEVAKQLAKDAPVQTITADPVTTPADEGATDMVSKTEKQIRVKKAAKQKGDRKVRTKRAAKAAGEGRVLKSYRLVDGIPEDIRKGSAGLAILEAIKKHGSATTAELREELPKSFKKPTMQFYLGKFQRDKIVTTKAERA